MSIGPVLPPGLARQCAGGEEEEEQEAPPGPQLPPSSSTAAPQGSTTGPQPPSSGGIQVSEPRRSYGPALPPGLEVAGGDTGTTHSESDSDSEGEVIGPMPVAAGAKGGEREERERRLHKIEVRSQAMKNKLTGKESKASAAPKREEWMTELPAEFKPLGIGARKFRTKVPETGDRSVWTDTPADRQRKAEERRSGREKQPSQARKEDKEEVLASVVERERVLAKQVEEYNKEHRSKSLMDIHRKRRVDEFKAKGGVTERQPFDRERDLEGPRTLVTPAKRRALMQDSKQSLDTKFQRGTKSFL